MVIFHPSHGQISTNRMYLPMDIAYIHGVSTKSMEKQPNMPPLPASFPLHSHTNQAIQTTPFASHIDVIMGPISAQSFSAGLIIPCGDIANI